MNNEQKQAFFRFLNSVWCLVVGIALAAGGLALVVIDMLARTDGMTAEGITVSGILGILLLIAGGSLGILHMQLRRGMFTGSGAFGQGNAGTRSMPGSASQENGIRIPPEGYLTAEIIGITRNLRAEGVKEGFHVICRYRDPVSGAETTFTSDLLAEYPGKQIIGRRVRVTFPHGDITEYHVDLSSVERV